MSPWMQEVRAAVEARLRRFLLEKREETERVSPGSAELAEAIENLTLRGGKRMRPVVLAAGCRALGRSELSAKVVDAGCAMEMLQSYLLIHDDWMDLDDERRGGPSVYGLLRRKHGDDHLGASLAVLAGDLAAAYSGELMTADSLSESRGFTRVLDLFWQIQREVLMGQHLDMLAHEDIERTYDLKTASYTVRGPILLGGVIGEASDKQLDALSRFSSPLGVAFQLRDEELGTFGDPMATGKPAGNDLRAGKQTLVLREGRRLLGERGFTPVQDVLGRADASDDEVSSAIAVLERCGARVAVEKAVQGKMDEALGALTGSGLDREPLEEIATLLVRRDR